ncbi:6-carboxytetrahydropterin synthase [Pelagicoccus sp. SDUM812003]|uniref:6-pyruvoyl trahydropterin synthase family protein n=1 Tax=Pelagicoccus sp. SDUM812003 TaxID=3041267 RepID=UPI00280CC6D7|nr:6-carboxytetrahydropterin synthase [Pelagicoccus sp. SDUM812003]MDQ8202048.1 6-carboxytetrahydropterin synthase [Pelagicoccus sp. SDUM812003]
MFTCQKTYPDIPFAHRQHLHDGHCAQIHGHNWTFTFTFGCEKLDECGFVVDFGKLKPVRNWIEENLDHACVFNRDDPLLEDILAINQRSGVQVYQAYIVDQCSSEGMARHLYEKVDPIVRELSEGRAFLLSVEVVEDRFNRATYTPERD